MNPLVSIIVPHHLDENQKYLSWCLKSITSTVGVEIETICISDADHAPEVPDNVTLRWDKTLSNVTKKWDAGLRMISPKSKYVMLISDDVMVSRYCIRELVESIDGRDIIMNPGSNCDSTTRFYKQYYAKVEYLPGDTIKEGYFEGITLDTGVLETYRKIPQKCTIEEMDTNKCLEYIIERKLTERILIDPGWVSFYCTIFPKSVIEKVGRLDESLDVRYNDFDYCNRARQLGIPSMINLGAFALHFGDQTLPKCTKAEEYAAADQAFAQKYHSGR